jgi:hypothetical protein
VSRRLTTISVSGRYFPPSGREVARRPTIRATGEAQAEVENPRMKASAADTHHPALTSEFSRSSPRLARLRARAVAVQSVAGRVCGYARLHGSASRT